MPVTIKDVARKAGVSIATVSRVLHGEKTVNKQMEGSVRRAIEELGYIPNSIAQSLKQNCSKVIGVTISDISVSFCQEIVKGIEKAFLSFGYATNVSSTYDKPENEEVILRQMLARRVDALLVNSTGQNDDMLEQIALAGMPVIFYDRRPRKRIFPAVYPDKKQSSYTALEHLNTIGHRRIMLASGPRFINSNYDRYMGMQRFMFDHEIDPANYSFHFGEFSYEDGFAVMETLMQMDKSRRPTAVITGSIAITAGIMAYCRKNGVSIPGDLALVSYGNYGYVGLNDLELTYLDDCTEELSKTLVELLEKCLNGEKIPQDYDMPLFATLHIGNTT